MIATIVIVYLAIGVILASAFCYINKDNSTIGPAILLWPFMIVLLLLASIIYILARIGEIAAEFIERKILKRK